MNNWRRLQGKPVVVTAGGVEYRGVVVEMGERTLVLRAGGGHREIAWARVTRMREDRGAPGARGRSILG